MKTDRESYYFRHYADSRNDPKIIRLIMKHGMEGYGIFWSILEILRTAKGYEIEYDLPAITYQLSHNCQSIDAQSLTIKSVCENFKLFEIHDEKLCSPSLTKFLSERSETYRKNRLSSIRSDNCQSIDGQLTDKARILKESKGKEIVLRGRTFTPPTVDEVSAYCVSNGYALDAKYFVDYYEARGWMLGKNKIKSWKACVRTWVTRQQQTPTKQPVRKMMPG